MRSFIKRHLVASSVSISRVRARNLFARAGTFFMSAPKARSAARQNRPRNRLIPALESAPTGPTAATGVKVEANVMVATNVMVETVATVPSNTEIAPASLLRSGPTDRGPMSASCRVQANIVARHERRALDWMCELMPPRVTPDTLTIGGVAGAVLAFFGYCGTSLDPAFVWLATLGIILHWFGDSLDGSLARYRGCERPSYGYYLDHSIDALCNLMIVGGLGLSTFVRLDVALFVLCGYYLLCMHVFLCNHVTGVFRLSFLALGPTELRLGLIGINTLFFFGKDVGSPAVHADSSAYDWFFIAVGGLFVTIFAYQSSATILMLRKLEPGDNSRREVDSAARQPLCQSADTNPAIFSK
jgi:phosphatidylglycerophosphate synthase